MEGSFKIHLFVKVFIVIWFSTIIAMLGLATEVSFLSIIQKEKNLHEILILKTISITREGRIFLGLIV